MSRHPTAAVLVLAEGREATIERCLEGLAAQCAPSDFAVIVIDSAPSDGAAERALHHPGVHWVLLTSQTGVPALCRRAIDAARFERLALLDAAYEPDPDWLAGGLALLDEGVDVAIGRSANGHFTEMFMVSHVAGRIPIEGVAGDATAELEEFVRRSQAAGLDVQAERASRLRRISGQAVGRSACREDCLPNPGLAPLSVRGQSSASLEAETGLISVVLCSGGSRPDQLKRCLDSLSRLEDPNFEILLVDNSASPAVKLDQLPTGVKYVHEPQRGLDRARNRGISESAGEIVAFVDDDCEVDREWLTGIRQAFSDPVVSFVTGRVRPARLQGEAQQWFEAHFSFDRGPCARRFTSFDYGGRSPLLTGEFGTGANMAFRRGLLDRIGRFDEGLDMGTLIGGGGDLDIFARALEHGAVGHYAPDAVVFHHHRDSLTKLRWQTWGYGLSQGAMCAKWLIMRPGRRLHAAMRYMRLVREHQHRVAVGRRKVDGYPTDLSSLELLGIALGPFAYIASVIHQACVRRR